ncbi:GNAT family N-acetyltransferase [Pseudomonas sp. UL073]|uniref:GNAT family N-acetyltransferase n=1 Tax=Zestomonas insulae TaxID=2809017 RepID=A0ABS2IEM6_9GAMM|nr:GNAT family N-acetyltransferase [Pseudomonas insulae]MBM7061427.1 GNAT family N-acetyltransferase [Pseudomonas insulae]
MNVVENPGAADLPRLLEVWEAAVRATHHFLSEADIRFYAPQVRAAFDSPIRLACVRAEDGQVAGFVGCLDGRIEMLFVDPAQHGRGFGRRLLEHAVAQHDARALDVNEQNPDALAFYRHLGFEVVGRSALDGSGKPFPLLHLRLPPG